MRRDDLRVLLAGKIDPAGNTQADSLAATPHSSALRAKGLSMIGV